MYKQGGAGLDRKRISDVLDKHLEKAIASPSTSRGSAGAAGRDHHRLVVPSSASSMPKGRCSEGDVSRLSPFMLSGAAAAWGSWRSANSARVFAVFMRPWHLR
jgi:casein kinase II subunit beta